MTSGQNRKQQIIAEATKLFSQHGFDRVTVKQVGEVCGVTEPAVYRHFKSKEAIYEAVLDSLDARMESTALFAELETVDEIDALLRGLAEHVIKFFTTHDDFYRLLLYSALHGHAKTRMVHETIRGRYVHFLVEQLDRLFAAGKIIEKNNEITARCFVGMVFDCALSRTLWKGMQGRVYRPDDVIANNVPIYARGLGSK